MSQVEDVTHAKLNNFSRGTYKSLCPLTWLLKIFAINSNIEDASFSKHLYILKCALTLSIFGLLDVFSLYYKCLHVFAFINPSVMLTDIVQMVYDFCQYVVDLWFVYKYGRSISLQYFTQYDFVDNILGITDYSKIKWKLLKLLGVFTLIWLTTSVFDYTSWFLAFGWKTPTVYSIAYIFLYVKILTTLDLSSHVMHIKYRLNIMGDIVQRYYSVAEPLPDCKGDFICNENWLSSNANTWNSKQSQKPMKNQSIKYVEIKSLTKCYLQLTEQVKFINCMFGFRILLNSLSLLIDIIRFTNLTVRIMLYGSHHMWQYNSTSVYFPAVSSMMRQITCVLVMVSMVIHCEMAYSERDIIVGTIDHLLINKNPSDKLRAAVIELQSLIKARPINFTAAKFFRLDNSLLVSITSVVVTYTIILLQSMN